MIRLPQFTLRTCLRPERDADSALVNKAAAGDTAAFGRIMKLHESALRGFITMRIGAPAADDVAQETWTACWLALPKFSGKSRFKAWLYGIATNKCVDYFRSRGHKEDSALHELDGLASDDAALGHVVDREAVRVALDKLPDLQREVVEMYYFAQLTLPEVSAAVGRNLNTVKYQFYRAHDQIAKELKAEQS